MTPNGQAETQYPQPLQMSDWTTTVPNSGRINAPGGQTSRQADSVQCLHTLLAMSQREPSAENSLSADSVSTDAPESSGCPCPCPGPGPGSCPGPGASPGRLICSMNATCRQVEAPSPPVLS